jgi:hypothetical protein
MHTFFGILIWPLTNFNFMFGYIVHIAWDYQILGDIVQSQIHANNIAQHPSMQKIMPQSTGQHKVLRSRIMPQSTAAEYKDT